MQVSGFFRLRLSIALAIAITWPAIPWPAPLEAGSQRLPLTTSRNEGEPVAILALRELTEQEANLHALNRLGFGPRPGDMEQVRAMGPDHWIEGQLHPESAEWLQRAMERRRGGLNENYARELQSSDSVSRIPQRSPETFWE